MTISSSSFNQQWRWRLGCRPISIRADVVLWDQLSRPRAELEPAPQRGRHPLLYRSYSARSLGLLIGSHGISVRVRQHSHGVERAEATACASMVEMLFCCSAWAEF